jgi:hypothetical protein
MTRVPQTSADPRMAGSHHERLDGSGYHRGTRGPALDQAARILAAADCYGAMREVRPYRPALGAPAAEADLMREAEEGRLSTRCSPPPDTACGSDLASCRPASRSASNTDGTFRAELRHVFADDEGRVVAMHQNSGTRAGKRLDVDCCIVFEIKDGRCTSGREHFYDLYAWDEFWS